MPARFFNARMARAIYGFDELPTTSCNFPAATLIYLPDDGGLAGSEIYTLTVDAGGKIFAGAENEIARWNGQQFEAITPTNGEADVHPQLLYPMKSGALWVLDGDRLRAKWSAREWVAEATEWRGLLGPASNRAMGAHEDRDGGLWFNHYGNGLFHITPDGHFQRLTSRDNLPSDRVGAWFQSRDGGVWVGATQGGLVRLRDRRFHACIGVAEGLGATPPRSPFARAVPGCDLHWHRRRRPVSFDQRNHHPLTPSVPAPRPIPFFPSRRARMAARG